MKHKNRAINPFRVSEFHGPRVARDDRVKIRVAIVEQGTTWRTRLKAVADESKEIELVACFSTAREALSQISTAKAQVVMIDTNLTRCPGMDCTRRFKRIAPNLRII